MGYQLLHNAIDTYVSQAFPTDNFAGRYHLHVRAGAAGNEAMAFITYSRPFHLGATITKATLRVYVGGGDWSGTCTLGARSVSSKYAPRRMRYNTMPTVRNDTVTVSKTGPAVGAEYAFDVTAIMQAVSDGTPWYGFRIGCTDSTNDKWIGSGTSNPDIRPTLEIEWSDAPQAPTDLIPSGNRAVSVPLPVLACDFTDNSGDMTMAAIQVQLSATDNFSVPDWDSGTVPSEVPELDLAAQQTPPAPLASGAGTYWRVRVQDGTGRWSEWSDSEQYRYVPFGALALVNPSPAAPYVTESTPPIDWTFPNQRAYAVLITDPTNTSTVLWKSGKITSTDQLVTPDPGIIDDPNATYHLILRGWDTEDREATPGVPAFTHVELDFTYNRDATVNPVTNLVATPSPSRPSVTLTWSRDTQPDKWDIVRDGKIIESHIIASELWTDGLNYSWTDQTPSGRQQHTYEVHAVVNGKTSQNNPSVTAEARAISTALMDKDGGHFILLANPDHELSMLDGSDVLSPLEGSPVFVKQSIGGIIGTLKGVIGDDTVEDLTARQMVANLEWMRKNEGTELVCYNVDRTFKCIFYGIDYFPVATGYNSTSYQVEGTVVQTDYKP